jgi:hypothetical protein
MVTGFILGNFIWYNVSEINYFIHFFKIENASVIKDSKRAENFFDKMVF